MSSLFETTFIANLGLDAKLVEKKDKTDVFLSLRVACTRSKIEWVKGDNNKGSQEWVEYTEWINITLSGKLEYLTKLAARLTKGTRVIVTSSDIPTPGYYISDKTKLVECYMSMWADKIEVLKTIPRTELELVLEFNKNAAKLGLGYELDLPRVPDVESDQVMHDDDNAEYVDVTTGEVVKEKKSKK